MIFQTFLKMITNENQKSDFLKIIKGFGFFAIFFFCWVIFDFSIGKSLNLKKGQSYVENEILIRLDKSASLQQKSKALTLVGTAVEDRFSPNFYKIILKKSIDVQRAVEIMRKEPGVLFAQPNYIYHLAFKRHKGKFIMTPTPIATFASGEQK